MVGIVVGDKAPEFRLVNQDEKTVALQDFSGRFLLIWWYPKADTPGWTIEGQGFRDRIREFDSKNCSILGVSFDDPNANRLFREKNQFPFDLVSDIDKHISLSFGVKPTDRGGACRMSVLLSPEGAVLRIYDDVKPADHPGQVLDDLGNISS